MPSRRSTRDGDRNQMVGGSDAAIQPASRAQPSAGLDVAVVSYRCRELLRGCLDSLRAHPPSREMNVVVVDNDSRDGSAEMVRREYPEVELVEAGANIGFAAATNLAIRRGSAPALLALNPDTQVTEGALETTLATLERHPEVAVVGPRLLRPDGTLDHAAKRSFPTPLSALGHLTGLGRRPGARGRLTDYRSPDVERGAVDSVNGAFMLTRRSAFEQVGGFDEGYWMYMEDLDLSYRLAEAGYVSYYEPDAVVLHVKGGTTGGERSPRLNWAFHRGMYRFYRAHYACSRGPLTNAAVYLGIAVNLAATLAQAGLRRNRERLRQRRRRVEPSVGGTGESSAAG